MDEFDANDVLEEWLPAKLKADTELMAVVSGVWHDVAPGTDNIRYPYVIWSIVAGDDETAAGGGLGSFITVQVKTVQPEVADDLVEANAKRARKRLTRVLGKASGVTAEGVRITCRGQRPVDSRVPTDGYGAYRHRGRWFRVFLSCN